MLFRSLPVDPARYSAFLVAMFVMAITPGPANLFAIAADFRARHPQVPLVLMGYANPMITRGSDWFADQCAKAGVDGVICVDIPPEEDPELGPALRGATNVVLPGADHMEVGYSADAFAEIHRIATGEAPANSRIRHNKPVIFCRPPSATCAKLMPLEMP